MSDLVIAFIAFITTLVLGAVILVIMSWPLTVVVGAGFQSMGLVGPSWVTVFWFSLASLLLPIGTKVK